MPSIAPDSTRHASVFDLLSAKHPDLARPPWAPKPRWRRRPRQLNVGLAAVAWTVAAVGGAIGGSWILEEIGVGRSLSTMPEAHIQIKDSAERSTQQAASSGKVVKRTAPRTPKRPKRRPAQRVLRPSAIERPAAAPALPVLAPAASRAERPEAASMSPPVRAVAPPVRAVAPPIEAREMLPTSVAIAPPAPLARTAQAEPPSSAATPTPSLRPAPPPIPTSTAAETTPRIATLQPGDVPPERLHAPPPRFPPAALASGARGAVRLAATIGRDGQVVDVEVVRGLPHGLSEAAVEAIRGWRFRPATRDGRPLVVRYPVIVRFGS